jgi:hypothetical protein
MLLLSLHGLRRSCRKHLYALSWGMITYSRGVTGPFQALLAALSSR